MLILVNKPSTVLPNKTVQQDDPGEILALQKYKCETVQRLRRINSLES